MNITPIGNGLSAIVFFIASAGNLEHCSLFSFEKPKKNEKYKTKEKKTQKNHFNSDCKSDAGLGLRCVLCRRKYGWELNFSVVVGSYVANAVYYGYGKRTYTHFVVLVSGILKRAVNWMRELFYSVCVCIGFAERMQTLEAEMIC